MLRDFRRECSCHGQVIRCKILNALIIKRLYQLRQSYLRNSHGSKKKRDSGQYYYCTYFNHDWNFHFWKNQGQKALAVFEQGMTPVLVRQFANLLLEQEKGETVLVCSGDDASGYNYTAGSLGRDMRAFGKELNARLQGRGGGSTQMVQGTFRASREEIEKVFQELARIEA